MEHQWRDRFNLRANRGNVVVNAAAEISWCRRSISFRSAAIGST